MLLMDILLYLIIVGCVAGLVGLVARQQRTCNASARANVCSRLFA